MKLFKFGGASVKDADSVRNLGGVLSKYSNDELFIVVSAMGKMTNSFEWLINSFCYSRDKIKSSLNEITDFHNNILWELFPDKGHKVYVEVNELLFQLEEKLDKKFQGNYDETYDNLIGYGELISTSIVSNYLLSQQVENNWIDAREIIKTDANFRQAEIDWELTENKIKELKTSRIRITQGFIGSDSDGNMTSLGREGSDFSAAIIGYCLDAESVTIWKDVAGVLNADPKYFPDATKIDTMSYREAIELSYYGATVIHPKTIKPLENKLIPLYVKSFLKSEEEGTVVQKSTSYDALLPSYIFIEDQILVSISSKDFSFIAEDNLSFIFAKLAEAKIKVNLIQNSAISFSVCFDNNYNNLEHLLLHLKAKFKVTCNTGVSLYTIRHYNEKSVIDLEAGKIVLLKQMFQETLQIVTK